MATSKNKKYRINIQADSAAEDSWTAQIVRQISSSKTTVSKSQSDFPTQAAAQGWAEQALEEFTSSLAARNARESEQRKNTALQRQQRSERKAAKTAALKAQQADKASTSEAADLVDSDFEDE